VVFNFLGTIQSSLGDHGIPHENKKRFDLIFKKQKKKTEKKSACDGLGALTKKRHHPFCAKDARTFVRIL
jgi:hypothetical protein